MDILTAQEMAAADRRSVEAGISVWELMQRAGSAVARFCLRQYPGGGLVVAVCGKGNNGGDGMVAAAELAAAGRPVRVLLLGSVAELKGDPARALEFARSVQPAIDVREIADEASLREGLRDAALVLDAVVGTGFKPPLRGLAANVRDLLAHSDVPVVAVDLPSGWDADSTAERAEDADGRTQAFRASAVVTFAAPKPAHVFGGMTPGDVFGPVVVAPIGTPPDALRGGGEWAWAGSAKRLAEAPRPLNSNKGKFGHVLIVGGSPGKTGAPSMASLAALRTGAGLVTMAAPQSGSQAVSLITPELMTRVLGSEAATASQAQTGLSLRQLEGDALATLLKGITVVGIGPGLGQEGTTPEFVRGFVERVSLPMVVDADGLNALAGHTDVLRRASEGKDKDGKGRVLVLTPHPGEMARLLGVSVKDVEADRVNIARSFAKEHGVTLVLKGWRTLIAHPDGRVAVNTSGNPSMAKGGSGDILTGIVAAMLAQYREDVASAVEAAVFLHGLAGDFACREQDEHTVLATDTVAHLAAGFRARVEDEDHFTWLCGLVARRPARENG